MKLLLRIIALLLLIPAIPFLLFVKYVADETYLLN